MKRAVNRRHRRFEVAKFTLTGLLCMVLLTGCNSEGYLALPERPDSVSEETLWIGVLDDGGVFAKIEKTDVSKTYMSTVYNDFSGTVLYSGQLKYVGKQPFDEKDFKSYT